MNSARCHVAGQAIFYASENCLRSAACIGDEDHDAATVEALGELGFATLPAGVKVDPMSSFDYTAGRMLGRVSLLGKRVSYHGSRTPGARLSEVSVCIDVEFRTINELAAEAS